MGSYHETQRRKEGRFASTNPEPASNNLSIRVTSSLRREIEEVAGDKVAAWVREAIMEKLNKENIESA